MYSVNIHDLFSPIDRDKFISEVLENKDFDIELIYGSNFKNTKFLRDFMESVCTKLWFSQKEVSRFILIVDELNNNAIEYWTDEYWENKMRIKAETEWNIIDIVIEVEDNWKWEKNKTALEMETLRAHQLKLWYGGHESIRGRWLFMITVKSVDRLYFKDTEQWGLIVWIMKKIEI